MALTDEERMALTAKFQEDYSANHDSMPFTKAQIRNTVNAVDDWLDTNLSSLNQAIPAAVRSNLTTDQKLRLLSKIILARTGQ